MEEEGQSSEMQPEKGGFHKDGSQGAKKEKERSRKKMQVVGGGLGLQNRI